ncbi:tRNA adenosine(34) deaminase TadA [Salicola sp. Rm-C-2C1-2]|uniref:tRNA adenosine(34) deaminase TadA n=1 Tax=Salicola sp. Rm-C-2C1-2 TaxID=3141321 RepID=UPI0032E3B3B8
MSAGAEDEAWMDRALALAAQAEALDEVPVGAVVVLEGKIVGEGFNQPISGHDPTAHAEVRALRDAAQRVGNYRLTDAVLYVTLEPCTMCAGALVHARIGTLVFGAREPKAGAIRSRARMLEAEHLNWQIGVREGVRESECRDQLTAFFARRRAENKNRRKDSEGVDE